MVAVDTFCAQEPEKLVHEGWVIDLHWELDMTDMARARVCLELACCTPVKHVIRWSSEFNQ
jgi:hypothetical protein